VPLLAQENPAICMKHQDRGNNKAWNKREERSH